jgi:hypothetical protein
VLVGRLAINFHKLREVCTTTKRKADSIAVRRKAIRGDLKAGGSMA